MYIPWNIILDILPGIAFSIHIHAYKKTNCTHEQNKKHIPKAKYKNTHSQHNSCRTADTFCLNLLLYRCPF